MGKSIDFPGRATPIKGSMSHELIWNLSITQICDSTEIPDLRLSNFSQLEVAHLPLETYMTLPFHSHGGGGE